MTHVVKSPPHKLVRKIVDKASHPRGAEVHYGKIATVGTDQEATVFVDGCKVAVPAIVAGSYWARTPSVGDHVIILLPGSDSVTRSQYLVLDDIP